MVKLGSRFSLCNLCGPLCLCGEIGPKNTHHRGTEIAQSTTERICLGSSKPFFSSLPGMLGRADSGPQEYQGTVANVMIGD